MNEQTAFSKPAAGIEQSSETGTVIIGAGPAGLATGACLRRKERPFIILEQDGRIGAAWHRHYERLHLHTDKSRSELPWFSYPENYPTYPSRLQVIDYLNDYADHFNLQPYFNQKVESARFRNNRWNTDTGNHRYISRNLVVATGFNRKPFIPDWPGKAGFRGDIIHSCKYVNGSAFTGKKVLVVGFGNSGGEIAIDLCEHGCEVSLAVRSPVNIIPRDLLGIPILAIAIPLTRLPARLADALTAPIVRLVFGDIGRLGLQKMEEGPFTQIQKRQRIPLIDVGTMRLIRNGKIAVFPGIERMEEREVLFTDDSRSVFDAIVLATGYRPSTESFLQEDPTGDREEQKKRGLFFCGFKVTPGGMLREIALEAKQIAGDIDQRISL